MRCMTLSLIGCCVIRLAFLFCLMMFSFPASGADVLADYILVEKAKRKLTLYHHDIPLKTYNIALGKHPVGPKRREGDFKTPEGFYRIIEHKADSKYHLALKISYPDDLDIERAKKARVDPGGRIMIHGRPDDYGLRRRKKDWTFGCISVSNGEIEEIWQLVPDGTPIEIRP